MIDPKTGQLVKSVFKEMRMNEISSVDRPAMPGATMSIMKRAPKKTEKPDEDEALEAEDEGVDAKGKKKPFGKRAAMTTLEGGHQHLVTDEVGPDMRAMSGTTHGAFTEDGNYHEHPWIKNADGGITIGMAHGHTHTVTELVSIDKAEDGAPGPTDASTSPGLPADSVGTVSKEHTMSQTNDQTDDTVAKQLEEANARAVRAEKVAELNDAQRGIFKSLDAEGQTAFLALTPDQRTAEVAKAADADAVVYTDSEGVEYRKSDDVRLVNLAKRADGEREQREATEKASAEADLRKRAEALSMPGTVEARMAILKGIDSLPEAERAPALESLQAQDAGMAKAFQRQGTSAVPTTSDPLAAIAKRFQDADPSITADQAMAKALSTPEGEQAYADSLNA